MFSLINLKQGFDEPVQDFAFRLQALGSELLTVKNITSSESHEQFLLAIFMAGLRHNIKRNLISQNFKNINEVLEIAKRIEEFNKEQKHFKNAQNY